MNPAAREIVAALRLEPLPREGGFFRQTWRGPAGSAILFLLAPGNFSALHRLRTDEVWHFCAGDPVEHAQLDPREGSARTFRLGPDVVRGDLPQLVAPAGVWQGARCLAPAGGAGWSLLGCTLAPAWREEDFELGARTALLREFPAAAELIATLTR